jgi:hypothetical protein
MAEIPHYHPDFESKKPQYDFIDAVAADIGEDGADMESYMLLDHRKEALRPRPAQIPETLLHGVIEIPEEIFTLDPQSQPVTEGDIS